MKIEKLFVPYNLAEMANKKGFNEPCIAVFFNPEHITIFSTSEGVESFLRGGTGCKAPLHQQLYDWLFKEYNIFIDIKRLKVMADPEDGLYVYWCEIGDFSSQHYKTPKQALTKGIEEALKLIKDK
jgi:hypothetical protein